MAYGRQAIMDGLRMAGQKLNDMDIAYALALEKQAGDPKGYVQGMGLYGRAVPLSQSQGAIAVNPYEALGGIGPHTRSEARTARMYDTAVLGANIASRYALPAGGVTLAGVGLNDLIAALGSDGEVPLDVQ